MRKAIQNKKSKSKEYMEFWKEFRTPLVDMSKALNTRNRILEQMVSTLKKIEKKIK